MSHVPHELTEEFPNQAEQIHLLKISDPHFRKLFDEYHRINRDIHRAETDVEPTSDHRMTKLRQGRLALKDELARMLAH